MTSPRCWQGPVPGPGTGPMSYGTDHDQAPRHYQVESYFGPRSVSSEELISSIDGAEMVDSPSSASLSTAAVLHYCKCHILRPYLRLLAAIGLRPFTSNADSQCVIFIGRIHVLQVLAFLLMGYVLQYIACFRRDRGFCYKAEPRTLTLMEEQAAHEIHDQSCYGSVVFSYFLPSVFHLSSYVYTLALFRVRQNEQLQNLMERVFLLSAHPTDGVATQRNLVRKLWVFIALSIVWVLMSTTVVATMVMWGTINFQWIEMREPWMHIVLEILLLISTLWHDMVQATITASYCLQSQLLTAHLRALRKRLLQRTCDPLDWMREVGEFKNLLNYLNEDLAPAVAILSVVNLSWASAGLAWLLKYDPVDVETHPITVASIANVALWFLASVAPFVQAARLSAACDVTQYLGHEVRARPFVYQDTPSSELDAVLIYASSLRLRAKLFQVPITGRYLCLLLAIALITALTLGQCHMFQTIWTEIVKYSTQNT